MVWCGVVWCGVVWCGVVWCGVVWCGVVWCGVVWCGIVARRRRVSVRCRCAVRSLDLSMACNISKRRDSTSSCWQLAVGSWQLAVGSWQLAVDIVSGKHTLYWPCRKATHLCTPCHTHYILPSVATSADGRNTSTHNGLPATTLPQTQTP